MDAILQQLLAFPPHPPPATPLSDAEYDKQINIQIQHLNHIPASKLTAPVPGGGDLLDVSAFPSCLSLICSLFCQPLSLKSSHLQLCNVQVSHSSWPVYQKTTASIEL